MSAGKRIVILGAGFGGLRAAMLLGRWLKREGREDWQVTLVEKNSFQTYTPLLYEVCATSKELANDLDLKSIVTFPLDAILGSMPVELVQDRVSGLDLIAGKIILAGSGAIGYDYLIIALGSETNYFRIEHLPEVACGLKTYHDAIRIRDAIWAAGREAENFTLVIGGGGSTGVELAAELKAWLDRIGNSGRCRTEIVLIHADQKILSGLSPRVAQRVAARLQRLSVRVLTNEKIVAITEDRRAVVLASGSKVPFDLFIWTAGVRPNSILGNLPLSHENNGRIRVAADMSVLAADPAVQIHGKVYAVGDAASCRDPRNGREAPMVARAAISQASVAAENITRDIAGKPPAAYQPLDYPYIIPAGGKYAVVRAGPLLIAGFPGWLIKGLVELGYLVAIMPLKLALKIWLKGLYIFMRNDNLG